MIVYLIGMPSCGKSKTAKFLGSEYNFAFVDLDKYIEQAEGATITDIFKYHGEAYFRNLESEALKSFSNYEGNIIIACGGGIVCKKENKKLMENGTVIFLDTPIDVIKSHLNLSKTHRPLLNTKSIEQIYEERIDLYHEFADYIIYYVDYEITASKIVKFLNGEAKKKVLVINGPNLNMLGLRDPNHYGNTTLEAINKKIKENETFEYEFFQSNHEGAIIDKIQEFQNYDAIIINPAAYTHTSLAIRDALEIVTCPKVEVHLSKVDEREDFRRVNYVRDVVDATFQGEKEGSYLKAVEYLQKKLNVL